MDAISDEFNCIPDAEGDAPTVFACSKCGMIFPRKGELEHHFAESSHSDYTKLVLEYGGRVENTDKVFLFFSIA